VVSSDQRDLQISSRYDFDQSFPVGGLYYLLRLVAYDLSLTTVSSVYLCINNLWTKIAPQKVAWHNFLNKLSIVFSQVVVTEGMGGEDSMVYDITLTEI
jgi:hypothetical protein